MRRLMKDRLEAKNLYGPMLSPSPNHLPIRAAKRDDPKAFRIAGAGSVTINAAEPTADANGKPKLPRFEGLAYTGAPMKPEFWWHPVIIDLDGVKIPSQHRPVLRQHDHQQIVGHTDKIDVDKKGIHVAGPISGEKQHADKVTVPASNGFQWQMSVGANPVRTEFLEAGESATVNGREVTGPMTISRETEIGEISFVPLGADGDTSATVAASQSKGNPMNRFKAALKALMAQLRAEGNIKAAKYSDAEIDDMDADACKAALKKCMKASDDSDDDDDDDEGDGKKKSESQMTPAKLKAEREKLLAEMRSESAAELARQNAIVAACQKERVTNAEVEIKGEKKLVNLAAHAIENNWTVDQTALAAIRAGRPSGPIGVPGGMGFSISAPDLNGEVLEAAIIQAGRHQMTLFDSSFYLDAETKMRRIPESVERQVKAEFNARYTDKVQQAAHTLFRGRGAGLQQVMVMAARANGFSGSDRITDGNLEDVLRFGSNNGGSFGPIRAESSSTMSISNVLANVQNKFALVGYLTVEQAWREIASIRSMNDFKASKSINLLADSEVKLVPDNGELADAALTDQAFANQADQFGRMLTIGRKSIINDDLGILTTAPVHMGLGAARGFNKMFWTVFLNLGNVNADDGNPFWANSAGGVAAGNHGTNTPTGIQVIAGGNLLAGGSSALSSASLQIAKQFMDNQIDPTGNPMDLDMLPILLFPPELWLTAMELVDPSAVGLVLGAASTTRQPNVNMWKGRLKPVMSRYLNKTLKTFIPNQGNTSDTSVTGSTTAWYNLYPAVAGVNVIEAAFLNGVDTPTVQTAGPDWNFNRLGISMRVVFDYGVNGQNFRAGVKSNGV